MKKFAICTASIISALTLTTSAICFSLPKDNNPKTISDENIVATISFGSGDSIIDMEDTAQVYDFSDIVVIGTVTDKLDATMSELSSFPYTPYIITVDKVIKGNISKDNLIMYISGGTVTVKQFVDSSKNMWERTEKMGLNKLSEKEQEEKYISYVSSHKKQGVEDRQYIIGLKQCEDSNYTVISDSLFIAIDETMNIDDINTKEDIVDATI